jgi:hypothetical protein
MPRASWQAFWPPWRCTASELAVLIHGRRVEGLRGRFLLLQSSHLNPTSQPASQPAFAIHQPSASQTQQLGLPSGGLTLDPLS